MSTIKVNNIDPPNVGEGVSIDGLQMPTAGALSNRNLIQNGAMTVAQRGISYTGSDAYAGPDRYVGFINATSYQCERSQQIDAPADSGLQYSYQLKTTTARTGTAADEYLGFGQFIEFQNIHNAVWGGNTHVTASFWVKSSIAGTFTLNLNPCNTNSGLNNDRVMYHATYTINTVNTWEYKVITVPLSGLSSYSILSTAGTAQIGRGLEVTWMLGVSSGGSRSTATLGWNTTEARNATSSFSSDTGFLSTVGATFQLTGVQVEVGSKATPFEHESYGQTVEKCKRYYRRLSSIGGGYSTIMVGHATGPQNGSAHMPFFPEMRTGPDFDCSATSDFDVEPRDKALTSKPTINDTSKDQIQLNFACDGNLSIGESAWLTVDINNGFVEFDAEL